MPNLKGFDDVITHSIIKFFDFVHLVHKRTRFGNCMFPSSVKKGNGYLPSWAPCKELTSVTGLS